MMYGFGDEPQPRRDSITLMQDLVIEYISGLIAKVRARARFLYLLVFLCSACVARRAGADL